MIDYTVDATRLQASLAGGGGDLSSNTGSSEIVALGEEVVRNKGRSEESSSMNFLFPTTVLTRPLRREARPLRMSKTRDMKTYSKHIFSYIDTFFIPLLMVLLYGTIIKFIVDFDTQ
jgi:hypothetical protein